jgi:hypothetical protein
MGRRVSDGKSAKVTVPESTTVTEGNFYRYDGWTGMAHSSVTTAAGQTGEVALEVDLVEYETSQIEVAQAFAKGTIVYWDDVNKRLTETAAGNTRFGKVTVAKDVNNVVLVKRTHIE